MLRGDSLTPLVVHSYAPPSDVGPLAKNSVRDINAGRAGSARHLLAGRDTRAVQLGTAGASGAGGPAELPDFVGGHDVCRIRTTRAALAGFLPLAGPLLISERLQRDVDGLRRVVSARPCGRADTPAIAGTQVPFHRFEYVRYLAPGALV